MQRNTRSSVALGLLAFVGVGTTVAHGALISSQVDSSPLTSSFVDNGTVGAGEYTGNYTNGGGAGFGGALGAGTVRFDGDLTTIKVAFTPGADLNDIAVVYLDTRAGGFTDAQMNDTADGGRAVASNLAPNADDAFPVGALPDFAVVFGNFGTVLFELNAGNTPNHLTFLDFQGDQSTNSPTVTREISINRSTLGLSNAGVINFFAGYSAQGFGSNESLPASSALNSGGNIGEGLTSPGYENHNQFTSVVPEPASLGLVGLGAVSLLARRRRQQH